MESTEAELTIRSVMGLSEVEESREEGRMEKLWLMRIKKFRRGTVNYASSNSERVGRTLNIPLTESPSPGLSASI